ncbi:hypothetical protein TNCV_4238331 [Trichonephila clavipes]|nr:hypothetical protein TNCV_4238331 [Trichonephila clavipes]
MQKKERGKSDFAFDKNSEIYLVRWNNNSVAINLSTLEPIFDVKRRLRGYKDKVNLKIPILKNSYNKHMVDVDHQDWLAKLYSIKIRGKMLYCPLFIHSLDIAIVNAWIIDTTLKKDEDLN